MELKNGGGPVVGPQALQTSLPVKIVKERPEITERVCEPGVDLVTWLGPESRPSRIENLKEDLGCVRSPGVFKTIRRDFPHLFDDCLQYGEHLLRIERFLTQNAQNAGQ